MRYQICKGNSVQEVQKPGFLVVLLGTFGTTAKSTSSPQGRNPSHAPITFRYAASTAITIYTDGACSGNPGPGGWGAILEWQGHQKELSGGEAQTTNNRMELTAVLTALAILKEPCIVELYSDSKYVVDAIEKGWLYGWQKKGWIKADKKPVLNVDLWQQLLPLLARHDVRLHWVKGHAENEKNNRCDQLAVAESKKFR